MHSAPDPPARTDGGCPIRVRLAHRSLAAPQSRFAALRALPRPLAPRHPPYTLLRLASHDTTHEPSRKKYIILVQFTRFGKIEVNLPSVLRAYRPPFFYLSTSTAYLHREK